MALFQWQRIAPAAHEIDQALAQVRTACGGRHPTRGERQAALALASEPAGTVGWGPQPVAGRPYGRVACVWWTDGLGRRHWFVEGDVYRLDGSPNPLWRCRNGLPIHPLWVLSPRHIVRREEPTERLLVVCDCGVVGTPEAIAWTGDCCGPCHDRRQDGTAAPTPLAFHLHQASVVGLAFAEDGRVVSCGYREAAPVLLDPATGETTAFDPIPEATGAFDLALLPDDRVVVVFTRSLVVCWDLATGQEVWRSRCHGELMYMAVSSLGALLAIDGVTASWILHADSGEGWMVSDDLSYFAFTDDEETLYAFDHDTRSIVRVEPFDGGQETTGLEFGEPEEDDCYSLACCPTRPLIASGGDHGRVRLGDLATGRWLHIDDGLPGLVSHLAFTPDGDTLASGHDDRVVFRDTTTGRPFGVLRVPGYGVQLLAFSPDGETLALGDEQGVVRLWPWRRLLGTA